MANTTETKKRPVKIIYAAPKDEKFGRDEWIEVGALWETANPTVLKQSEKPAFTPLAASGQFDFLYMDPKPAKDAQ